MLQDLLQNMYMQIAQEIHESRDISWEVIHRYFDGQLITAQKATGSDDFDEMIAADQMYEATQRFRKEGKVVYTSMGNMAASGGYYVAMGTDKIFANTLSLTGSIGVMSSYYSLEGLYQILGISHESIKTGKYMDLFSSKTETDPAHLKLIHAHQQDSYRRFSRKVMIQRHLNQAEVFSVAQGQIFTGKQAKSSKLVDEIGSFQDSIKALSKAIDVPEDRLIFIRKKAQTTFSLGDIFSLFF
eukprot:COSAG01_NODE_6_length_54687_cov_500.907599_24_plen_242_part_00